MRTIIQYGTDFKGSSWITRTWIVHRPCGRKQLRDMTGFLPIRYRKDGQNSTKDPFVPPLTEPLGLVD